MPRIAYTTITRLKAQGVTIAVADEAFFYDLIEIISKMINKLTGQWFTPLFRQEIRDGNNSTMVRAATYIPFLQIEKISMRSGATNPGGKPPTRRRVRNLDFFIDDISFNVDLADVEITGGDNRMIENRFFIFPNGIKNVLIDCWQGWLDDQQDIGKRNADSLTTTSDITSTSTTVLVADSKLFSVSDHIVFLDATDDSELGRSIIESIDDLTNVITIAPMRKLRTDIPIGSKAISFGRTPTVIERIAIKLIIKNQSTLANTSGGSNINSGLIKGEQTDEYEIEFHENKSLSANGLGNITGDPLCDQMLAQYTAPPIWHVI